MIDMASGIYYLRFTIYDWGPGFRQNVNSQTANSKPYDGGYHHRGTFVEYSKGFIDAIYARHSRQPGRLDVTDFMRYVSGLHFYDRILGIEKLPCGKPYDVKTGEPRIAVCQPPKPPLWRQITRRIVGK